MQFSKKGEPDRIVIRGVQKAVEECEAFIRKKLEDEEAKVSATIEIDNRVHSRLIGLRGKNLSKVQDKFRVEIKFAGRASDEVTVKGKSQESVDEACDYLKNLEEEYLQDVTEKEQYVHPSNREASSGDAQQAAAGKGFVVRGAPWENGTSNGHHYSQEPLIMPDTSNMEDFPMISAIGAAGGSQKSTWGPMRK